MKISLALLLLLGLAPAAARADDPPQLKAIQAKYDLAHLDQNEKQREKYVMELATLRWKLSRRPDDPAWQAVDAEIARHPAPADSDGKALSRKRVGLWHSPRHDYLFRADGTWTMDPELHDPESTHGTWSIQGNQYSEGETTYLIILANADNFIIVEPGNPAVFYEKRTGTKGLPF